MTETPRQQKPVSVDVRRERAEERRLCACNDLGSTNFQEAHHSEFKILVTDFVLW